jgi:hypothetical protein
VKSFAAVLNKGLWLVAGLVLLTGSAAAQRSLSVAQRPAAGELSKIILNISPDQVVGAPFHGSAEIILLDSSNNLITDYDLGAQPITLVPDHGDLIPNQLSDPGLMDTGVVDFLSSGVRYWGSTGQVAVYATNGTIRSSSIVISASGYDIVATLDHVGSPIGMVFSGASTTLRVVVQNRGHLQPNNPATLRASFRSGGAVSSAQFVPGANDRVDTVTVTLPTTGLAAGLDTLILQLEADFPINSVTETTVDQELMPVTVMPPVFLSPVAGSFQPDSVYAGVDFPVSFNIQASGFSSPIDSSAATIELLDPVSTLPVATVFQGAAPLASFAGGVIAYSGITGRIDSALALPSQSYAVRLNYRLMTDGNVLTLATILPDSLFILRRNALAYVSGTLAPGQVAAGAQATFSFDLAFAGTVPLEIQAGSSSLTLSSNGFSASVSLAGGTDQLVAGVNHMQTEPVFIPSSLLGESLAVGLSFNYRRSASPSFLTFLTTFNDQRIAVGDLPIVQIVDLSALAPNNPRVNTEQPFQLRCLLANVTNASQANVTLRLATTGTSTFTALQVVPLVPPFDTVEVLFNVTASQLENDAEIFHVDMISSNVGQLPPVDNVELITVQKPASLALAYTLLGGGNGYLAYGEPFSLTVSLANFGRSGITQGSYLLTTGGADLGVADSLRGAIDTHSPVAFVFHAPDSDLVTTINFAVIDQPLDSNTLQPAPLRDPVFSFRVLVVDTTGDLFVSTSGKPAGPVILGETESLIALEFDNHGQSSATELRIDSVRMHVFDIDGAALDATSVLDPSASGLYEGGLKVASATAAGSLLTFVFGDLTLSPQEHLVLTVRALIKSTGPAGFGLHFDTNDVAARFVTGPLADSGAVVAGESGRTLLHTSYATTVADFGRSFAVEENPYHPEQGPARFAYVLNSSSGVRLQVFSLIGEPVYETTLQEGDSGTGPGSHVLEWDARNGHGDTILNGVYIVVLTELRTGAETRLKLAVVR